MKGMRKGLSFFLVKMAAYNLTRNKTMLSLFCICIRESTWRDRISCFDQDMAKPNTNSTERSKVFLSQPSWQSTRPWFSFSCKTQSKELENASSHFGKLSVLIYFVLPKIGLTCMTMTWRLLAFYHKNSNKMKLLYGQLSYSSSPLFLF